MLLDGEDITTLPAPLRTRRGLGRAFQLTQLFPNLTVQENVRLAVQARHGGGLDLLRVWLDRRDWIDEARAILDAVRLADKALSHASALPHGDQRKLEVALLMALDPQVYMFDEPTAGMSVDEVPVILDLIRALKSQARPHHPARRAQDGRGARAGRPHHRAAQRRSSWPTASRRK